jgi:hypothetical protein
MVAAAAVFMSWCGGAATAQDTTVTGLGHAKVWDGPDARGNLVVQHVGQRCYASLAGYSA